MPPFNKYSYDRFMKTLILILVGLSQLWWSRFHN